MEIVRINVGWKQRDMRISARPVRLRIVSGVSTVLVIVRINVQWKHQIVKTFDMATLCNQLWTAHLQKICKVYIVQALA